MTDPEPDPLDASATAEDIANCYRIFLNREAESSAVILEKEGQRRRNVLTAFITSSEFYEGSVAAICDSAGDINSLRATMVGPASFRWAAALFGVATPIGRIGRTSRLFLFSEIAKHPFVEDTLDRTYGTGMTARLLLSTSGILARPLSLTLTPASPPYTTPRDQDLTHRLLFERGPAEPLFGESRTPMFETMALILASPDFRLAFVEPALNDQLTRDTAIDEQLQEWVATTFDVSRHRNRLKAIAEILSHAMIKKRLHDFAVDWPIDDVVNALQIAILDKYALEDCLTRQDALVERFVRSGGR